MNSITFETYLDGRKIEVPDSEKFRGKRVIVTVVEIPEGRKRNWTLIGAADLKGALDDKSIRDAAYE